MASGSTSNGAERVDRVDRVDRASRLAGSLIGQALGDALGHVVECRPAADCQAWFRQLDATRAWPAEGDAGRGHAWGQYSDDTQLARELAASCVAQGHFQPDDYAARIAGLFARGEVVDGGRATAAAAARLSAGVPWTASGTPAPVASNGSAMRAAPIGLLHGAAFDPAALRRDALDQGRITHADPRAGAGSLAIAMATAWALRDARWDGTALCAALAAATQDLDAPLADGLRALPRWSAMAPEAVLARVLEVGERPAYADGWQGVSAFVTHGVLWSLYAVLCAPDDPWRALGIAVWPGGDVDTLAAMTGAIVGARHGLVAWPDPLARSVHDRGAWGYEALVALADALAPIGVAPAAAGHASEGAPTCRTGEA